MDERENEIKIKDSEIKEIDVNLHKICKSICKIFYKNEVGTGFFIKLYKNNKEFFCIMTNEHIITQELINSNKKIIVYYDAQNERIDINLNIKERFIKEYKEFDLDITIIEILKEDNIDKKYLSFILSSFIISIIVISISLSYIINLLFLSNIIFIHFSSYL